MCNDRLGWTCPTWRENHGRLTPSTSLLPSLKIWARHYLDFSCLNGNASPSCFTRNLSHLFKLKCHSFFVVLLVATTNFFVFLHHLLFGHCILLNTNYWCVFCLIFPVDVGVVGRWVDHLRRVRRLSSSLSLLSSPSAGWWPLSSPLSSGEAGGPPSSHPPPVIIVAIVIAISGMMAVVVIIVAVVVVAVAVGGGGWTAFDASSGCRHPLRAAGHPKPLDDDSRK